MFGFFWGFKINFIDFKEGKIAFTVFGRPYLARYIIPGAQIEAPDLARGDVNIVRSGQV